MPSPVKNGQLASPPPPRPTPPDDARGEVFRDELSRKQSSGATGAADSALARRPETNPPGRRQQGKPARPHRTGGGGYESPEVRAAPDKDKSDSRNRIGAADQAEPTAEGEPVATSGEDDNADGAAPETESSDLSPASATVAPVVATGAADVASEPGQSGADEATAGDANLLRPSRPDSATANVAGAMPLDGLTGESEPSIGEEPPVPRSASPGRASVSTLFGDAAGEAEPEQVAPKEAKAQATTVPFTDAAGAQSAAGEPGEALDDPLAASSAAAPATHGSSASAGDVSAGRASLSPGVAEPRPASHVAPALPQQAPALPPEARFVAANHENIVTSMRAEVLPNGGTMRLRLDPPQLGTMNVTVQIQDGLITAAFETTSDEATRLLGHSLNQLKTVLESHGIGIDRLQVTPAPRESQQSNTHGDARHDQGGNHSQEQEQSARQEQQRREMLRRMWRRLSGEPDPLDLTA
jgi:flagellar hook-length control protein FliK